MPDAWQWKYAETFREFFQLSVVSYQLSAVSHQLSVISCQLITLASMKHAQAFIPYGLKTDNAQGELRAPASTDNHALAESFVTYGKLKA